MSATITLEVQGTAVDVTNPHKVLFPETGFTQGDVIDFYGKLSPILLAHLQNRPVSLERPGEGPRTSLRPIPPFVPAWLKASTERVCLINDLRALVWAANRVDPELHLFLHQAGTPNQPIALVIDLDPSLPAGIADCGRVALELRSILSTLKLKCFAKTSGSRCLQIYVPLNTLITYAKTKAFARRLADLLESCRPGEVVSRLARNLRRGKVFVDWTQNDAKKTMVCAYSLRVRKRPTVSTPVTWEEVELAAEGKTPLRFEAREVLRRVEKWGDLFAPVGKLRQTLPAPTALPSLS